MGGIAVATMAVGGVLGAIGSYQQAQAQAKSLNYQAAVAENNAKMAEYAAADASRRGDEERKSIAREYARVKGAGKTAFAAGNVALGVGTTLDWEEDVEAAASADIATSQYNEDLQIWESEVRASGLRSEAGALRAQGRSIRRMAPFSAASSLLAGGSSAASTYYNIYGGK